LSNSKVELNLNQDHRGNLGVLNVNDLPFRPKRFFWIFDAPANTERAGHAHLYCDQFLFSLSGCISIKTIDLMGIEVLTDLHASEGYLLKAKTWLEIMNFSENAVLGVFASHEYDRSEYLESLEEFHSLKDSRT
jgi:UDP-2-acetamido-3-amino-2,3-dideoxy-glucuronate N-acetyltransferase